MPTSREIRQQFLHYFQDRHGHTFVPSSPVVPHDDPTLLFANAGMNQFKDVFLGTGRREYNRAVNSQKCIRAGGKHNDLEDVGRDTYHHTFFEMLGNWSFGDYFKKEAIAWAWDLLTNVWGLDKTRLHATVFAGDPQEDLAPDREAADLWTSVTDIDPSHIHYGSKKDNFWEMGDTGPCGPCSEIHVDLTPDKSGAELVNAGDPRVIEIWNLVFIQYNRNSAGLLTPLPAKHVDTGMGFERICAVLQGKTSNYDTDVFQPLFEAIHEVTGARKYTGNLKDPIDTAYRVIADHVRCLTFALTDGAVPSNEGRGYVLRRILRRAVRHGRQTLGRTEPFLHQIVPAVVNTMGDAFPELRRDPQHVQAIIREEEESFGRTIDRGIALFEEAAGRGGDRISGEDAFKLYDTYGFPLDLTQVMARERGLFVDVQRFNQLMEEARQRSRAGAGGGDERHSLVEIVQQQNLPETDFLGYEDCTATVETFVRVYPRHDNAFVNSDHLSQGVHGAVVVGATPFCAEAGGQVGDTGTITVGDVRFRVEDTIKIGNVHFHLGIVEQGRLSAAEKATVSLEVDEDRRQSIRANHTATHLMNWALREHLGDHVQQRGSLVDDTKTRFDFSHNEALGDEQVEQIERSVNDLIARDMPVYAGIAPQDQALKINGLRAVFGEKYPPRVRVVAIGVDVDDLLADPQRDEWRQYSIEFCGGTHLRTTGDAEGFVITEEEAVAKGVRRVVALTGPAAHAAQADADRLLNRLTAMKHMLTEAERRDRQDITEFTQEISSATLPLVARRRLNATLGEIQQMLKEQEKQRSKAMAENVVEEARRVADEAEGDVIIARFEGADADALRTAMDVIRKKSPDAALLLAGVTDGKVTFVAAVPDPKIKQGLKAGDWVREVAKVVGGGGGGRPDMAQAGGKDPSKLDEALATARQFASEKVNA